MPSGSVEDADAIAEMPVSVIVSAPTDVVALTLWSVSIEMVQHLESRFQRLKFLGRASAFCLRFLRLCCYALENAVIKPEHDFRTKNAWKLFEKTLFDTEHAEYVDECLHC
jgi:hypothetical protein